MTSRPRKHNDYSITIILSLLTLLIFVTACQPTETQTQTAQNVRVEPVDPTLTSVPEPDQNEVSGSMATAAVESISGLSELDETDTQLFERTAELFDLFAEKSDEIWNSGYRLDKMSLMYVRTDGENDQYAYLLNHPKAAEMDGAELVRLPSNLNLPPVYRLDTIPNAALISAIPNFSFNERIDGEETYLMKYTSPDVDTFSSPVSHDWSLFVAHEGLHDYQAGWVEAPSNFQDTANYPLEADHIALIMLEDRVIKAALTAENDAELEAAVRQFVAIRQARIDQWDSVRLLDLPQEQMEGTARFIEHRLGSLVGFNQTNEDSFSSALTYVPQSQVRDYLAFGRFYSTGAALTHLVAELDIGSWSTVLENGKSQFDLLTSHYNLTPEESAALLEDAKEQHNFDDLVPQAQQAADTAASEPTDIWGEAAYADGEDVLPDGGEGEGVEFVFPTKAYSDAPESLVFKTQPAGYDLVGGFTIQPSEISPEFMRPFYSPQGNEIQVIDWSSNSSQALLRVTSSTHSYNNLDEALAAAPDFGQPSREEIEGQSVLIDTFSDGSFAFSTAKFLRGSEFVVIEGEVSKEDMVKLVADLLASSF